jgi:cytochrome c
VNPHFRLILLAAAGVLVIAGTAVAQSGDELVKSTGCGICHAADTKKVGPSFKDIAAKHKGDPAAADKLVGSLKAAKKHPKVAATDAELKTIVTHMLATK